MRNFGQWITTTPPQMEWIVNPGSVQNFQTNSHPLALAFCYPAASPGYPATISNSWPFKNFMVPLPNDQETHTFTVQHHRNTSFGHGSWTGFLFGKSIGRRMQFDICGPDPPKMMNLIISKQILGLLVEVPLLVGWMQQNTKLNGIRESIWT